ncbi:MAG: tail tape measure protein [Novosphingobium sp. 28-62-57]|uniref:tail tape measure protein n=1 Tax=unclassified Novosphingobium TaxID=2644732 RepID=UPI000BCE4C8A|nr:MULTISPECIES: tail tape measure protein [unclassified Novosphingobium]OYW48440.1 MAG: tail tape measure protein [Novosphingobium sp. 12-62-10]OYZ09289.1 MAG: tail tape measure protein [Novosphingobium sp. 28-62-57]
MVDELDTLMIDVRANTSGFTADVAQMRGSFDSILVDGFGRAGDTLERGLLGAIRRGSLGFEDLRRVALNVMGDIAAQAVSAGIGSLGGAGAGQSGGIGGLLSGLVGSIFGLPGRATGGPVAPGRGYLVGERGPELFVPTSAGRVEPSLSGKGRDVNVSIRIVSPQGSSQPESLRRSGKQVAQAVRRALSDF